jgi:hypothetical protein
VLALVVYLCPSSVRVVATFSGTVLSYVLNCHNSYSPSFSVIRGKFGPWDLKLSRLYRPYDYQQKVVIVVGICVSVLGFSRLSMGIASDGSSVQHVLAAVMLLATSYHKYRCFR